MRGYQSGSALFVYNFSRPVVVIMVVIAEGYQNCSVLYCVSQQRTSTIRGPTHMISSFSWPGLCLRFRFLYLRHQQ